MKTNPNYEPRETCLHKWVKQENGKYKCLNCGKVR